MANQITIFTHNEQKTRMTTDNDIVTRTRRWLDLVVVGCNFCPFAQRELQQETVHYEVLRAADRVAALNGVMDECLRLDRETAISTSLLIFADTFLQFEDFLLLLDNANTLLQQQGYEGTYQLASFHPDYCFADCPPDDAANYTNRSPHPMLHLLREADLEQALMHYPQPELIPERNIEYARQQGNVKMQALLNTCQANQATHNDPEDVVDV